MQARALRPGAITRAQIEAVLGTELAHADETAPRASGRLEQHYAPRTPLELVEPGRISARVNELRGTRLAMLAPAAALLDRSADIALRLIAPADPQEYARRLYTMLHELDAAGAQRILIAQPPAGPDWEAVADRLARAAG